MRRLLLLALAAAALTAAAPAASANPYCDDVGPVPGYGPVCTATCVLGDDLRCLLND